MKVYVDELPKCCYECHLCQQNDIGCFVCYGFEEEFVYVGDKNITKEKLKNCPLQSITDYTKQVCEQIRVLAMKRNNDQFYIMVTEILDDIQRKEGSK